ncbi:MAG TPA: type II secretion system F family protein [Candidatus Elarobacter sp.]|jgi:tight adherence protein B|nr:type II secretion system F family protein [Candidatus Elarobacter sp.]
MPFAIVLGVIGTMAFAVYAAWGRIEGYLAKFVGSFASDIERAGLRIPTERLGAIVGTITVGLWLASVVVIRPNPIYAILLLPLSFAVAALGFRFWIKRKVKARLKAFDAQLELALRLISSGLRVGLSLRQALVLVTEEMGDPAQTEFSRVIARSNIGVPMDVALDDLVRRVPSEELAMMVDAIQVQSKTGGNLGKILDHLAGTIKGRRQIVRKIAALTGEATLSGWVIGLLPVGVGTFIMIGQPAMRHALLTTNVGHMSLIAFTVLEVLGIGVIRGIMRMDI